MKLADLRTEYVALRGGSGLVLDDAEVLSCMIMAAQQYAAYGSIRSIDLFSTLITNDLLEAPAQAATLVPPMPDIDVLAPYPIKDMSRVDGETVVTTGEWAVIRPLAWLYVERENALRLEASRQTGIEAYGRSSSEVAAEIATYEADLPGRSFSYAPITI